MNAKSKQWLLFGLVFLVWGYIGYRFFSYGADEDISVEAIRLNTSGNRPTTRIEPYKFMFNYSDPFLKTVEAIQEEPLKQEVSPSVMPRRSFHLPQVIYMGLVNDGSRKTGILRINERPFMIKESDTCGGFRVEGMEANLLKLRYLSLDSIIEVSMMRNSVKEQRCKLYRNLDEQL